MTQSGEGNLSELFLEPLELLFGLCLCDVLEVLGTEDAEGAVLLAPPIIAMLYWGFLRRDGLRRASIRLVRAHALQSAEVHARHLPSRPRALSVVQTY